RRDLNSQGTTDRAEYGLYFRVKKMRCGFKDQASAVIVVRNAGEPFQSTTPIPGQTMPRDRMRR
ncbi:MAG: hypothetical protein ACR2RB_18405, partial [Gammaproteobacteria bacterium]